MRITLSTPSTGIFYSPGLARPVTVDVDTLPAARAQKLRSLAVEAGIFLKDIPAKPASAASRDMQQFVINVEDGEQQQTLRLTEEMAGADNALKDFVALVRSEANLARTSSTTGSDSK